MTTHNPTVEAADHMAEVISLYCEGRADQEELKESAIAYYQVHEKRLFEKEVGKIVERATDLGDGLGVHMVKGVEPTEGGKAGPVTAFYVQHEPDAHYRHSFDGKGHWLFTQQIWEKPTEDNPEPSPELLYMRATFGPPDPQPVARPDDIPRQWSRNQLREFITMLIGVESRRNR